MRTLIVPCLLLSLASIAHAESPEERARVLYAAGKDHYEHGRYEAAVTEFESAYSLSPRPELRYNLYLAYERLGRFEAALDHLESYLAEGDLPRDERVRLEARRDALRDRAAAAPAPAGTVTAGAPPAGATAPVAHPPSRRGFMARAALGLGYANAESDAYRVYGGTGDLTLLLGWRFIDNLAVHLSVWGASMVATKILDKNLDVTFDDNETRYSSAAIGGGITWDLPARFYLSGSLGGGSATAERGNKRADSDVGLAILLMAGKDWHLGGDWSIGLAASFAFLSIKEKTQVNLVTRTDQSSVMFFSLLGTVAFD